MWSISENSLSRIPNKSNDNEHHDARELNDEDLCNFEVTSNSISGSNQLYQNKMENVQGGRSIKMKSVESLTLKHKTTYLFEYITDKKKWENLHKKKIKQIRFD